MEQNYSNRGGYRGTGRSNRGGGGRGGYGGQDVGNGGGGQDGGYGNSGRGNRGGYGNGGRGNSQQYDQYGGGYPRGGGRGSIGGGYGAQEGGGGRGNGYVPRGGGRGNSYQSGRGRGRGGRDGGAYRQNDNNGDQSEVRNWSGVVGSGQPLTQATLTNRVAVSLVTPVNYADLVAYRGRMFQEVAMEMKSSGSVPSSFDQYFYTLQSNLKDSMFFI